MHTKLISEASHEVLRSFLMKSFDEIKEKDHEMYEELEMDLYKEIYGCHFNDYMLEKALSKMKNEDGSIGGHWTLQETNNLNDKGYNKYDWNYVMNMLYSDYYKVFGNDTNVYVKMAKSFIDDKDAPEGKAFKYYKAMNY